MKRTISVNITLDTKTACITNLDITEGAFSRTEIIADGIDEPISICDCLEIMDRELGDMLEIE